MAAAGRGLPAQGPASSAASRRQAGSVPFLLRKREPGAPPRMAAAGRGLPAQGPAILPPLRAGKRVPFHSSCENANRERRPTWAAAGRGLPAQGPASSAASRRQAGSVPFLLRKCEPGALSPHCSPFCREAGAPLRSAPWFDRLWKRPRPGLRGCGLFVFPGKRRLYGPSFAAVSAPIFSKRTGCVRFPGSRSTVLAASERRLRARAPCRRRCTQSSCRPGGRSASAPPPCAASLR